MAYDGDSWRMQSLDVSFRLPTRHHGQFGRQFQAPHIHTRHHGQFGRQFQAPHIYTRHHGQFGRQFQAPICITTARFQVSSRKFV